MLKKETERISNSINEIEIHEMEILEKTASQIEKSRQTIMESKNQLLWSNSNRNQEKINPKQLGIISISNGSGVEDLFKTSGW